MNKRTLSLTVGVAILLAATLGFAANNSSQEISTAAVHAHLAASAPNVATVHLHLHHVINCLVGTKGKLFDADAGNPCKGMGDGALNDLGNAPAEHKELRRVLVMSERALRTEQLAAAREDATHIADALKEATPKK
ncbi:MAG: hypothetical protein ACRESE_05355 [Gammaproteobacteria bacterium]